MEYFVTGFTVVMCFVAAVLIAFMIGLNTGKRNYAEGERLKEEAIDIRCEALKSLDEAKKMIEENKKKINRILGVRDESENEN